MQGSRTAVRLPRLLLGTFWLCAGLVGCQSAKVAKQAAGPKDAPADAIVLRAGHSEQPAAAGAAVPEQLTEAMDAYRKDDFSRAERLFRNAAEDKKTDPLVAEKARFYQAECLRCGGHLPTAADTYNRMLIDFPAGVYREQGVQRLFEIADFWLDDTRRQMQQEQEQREGKRWLVAPIFVHWDKSKPFLDSEGRALQLLEQVHYNDPTGPCSDKALYLLGYVNFYRGNYKESDQFFSQLVEAHDKSPFRAKAAELAIMSKNNSTGGPLYDPRPTAEALKLLQQAKASMPELANRSDFLDGQLVAIRMQQADKDFGIAEFYRKTGHPGSAYFYYELVRRRYPETDHARRALKRMNELRAELESSRRDTDVLSNTRRGFNKYVLGAPEAELKPGQNLPPSPVGGAAASPGSGPAKETPASLPADLMPRQ